MKWDTIANAKRILAREQGYVQKDWGGRLPVALAYANTYYVGMSSLGFQTIYRLFNDLPYVACERVFWTERSRAPLITLESQRRLLDCAVLAFSLSFELDYFRLANMLEEAEMPVLAHERDETYPLVLAGGPAVTANPEPLAPICDAFVIGEAEEIIAPLAALLWEAIDAPRDQVLEKLAQLPGLYVPDRSPLPVRRQWVRLLDNHPTASVIFSPDHEFGDMYLMEISRGCGHGCRFCLAGYTYRPVRERSLETLLALAKEGARYRDCIGLIGAAVSDYSKIDDLIGALRRLGLRISASSLRVKPLPEKLVAALAESGSRTLTLAPEAGCERLRIAVHKGFQEADILEAAELAQRYRFPALKLYFMVGLPGETTADIMSIVSLVRAVAERFKGEISINATPFVPKAHTPFQWAAMASQEVLEERIGLLAGELRAAGIGVHSDSAAWARVQGVLSRGDRRLGHVLAATKGKTSLRLWKRALREQGLSEEAYLRPWPFTEPLPWSVVDMGVSEAFLRTEAERAARDLATEFKCTC